MFYNTQIDACQPYSFAGGIYATRRYRNFNPYVVLQAWAGTPASSLRNFSSRQPSGRHNRQNQRRRMVFVVEDRVFRF
ncbi:MAG TPA: hypothetical protein VNB49_03825, partial [Candidatus Dormibacteraeota bacterium]|nr:hypothetical protein [Candidatus Dormibacteraeota bacterium]